MSIRVMTFNLRGSFFETDGQNVWQNRADLTVRTIQKYAPDLLGLQEYQAGNQAVFERTLTEYAYERGNLTNVESHLGMYNPIYYRRERFTVVDVGSFYLSPTPSTWSIGWDAKLVRGATWVKLVDRHDGREFFYLNTHLDHIGEQARVASAQLIVEQLAQRRGGLPAIITADFNSRVWAIEANGGALPQGMEEDGTPAGTVHQVFTAAGYVDTYQAVGHAESAATNTFHNFLGTHYPAIGQRIDWVLVDGFTAVACDILHDAEPPLYPSDHYPVLAVIE